MTCDYSLAIPLYLIVCWHPENSLFECRTPAGYNRHVDQALLVINYIHSSRRAAGCTMNSLYTHGVRQTNSLTADLERLRNGDNSASLLGLLLLTFEGKGFGDRHELTDTPR
jgi:hypothetical protein